MTVAYRTSDPEAVAATHELHRRRVLFLSLNIALRSEHPDHMPWISRVGLRRVIQGLEGTMQPRGQWRRSSCGRYWRPAGQGRLGRFELKQMAEAEVNYALVPGVEFPTSGPFPAIMPADDEHAYLLHRAPLAVSPAIWSEISPSEANDALGFDTVVDPFSEPADALEDSFSAVDASLDAEAS